LYRSTRGTENENCGEGKLSDGFSQHFKRALAEALRNDRQELPNGTNFKEAGVA
jgi:hypothetical protein